MILACNMTVNLKLNFCLSYETDIKFSSHVTYKLNQECNSYKLKFLGTKIWLKYYGFIVSFSDECKMIFIL